MASHAAIGFETHLAGGGEPVAQALPGAQQARLGGRQPQAVGIGKAAHRLPLEIAGAQDVGVIRRY